MLDAPLRTATRCAAVFALIAVAAPARADDRDVDTAKRLYQAGKQAYAAGRFAAAARAFEESYKALPLPAIAFSMAQAYRRQYVVDENRANLERAIELYRQYLEDVPKGRKRKLAVELLEKLETIHRELDAAQSGEEGAPAAPERPEPPTEIIVSSRTPGAVGIVDGKSLGAMPVIAKVDPGRHSVRIEAPGFFAEEIDAVALKGRPVPVAVELREKPGRLRLQVPPGSQVHVDGKRLRSSEVDVPAGRHRVVVTRRGDAPVTRQIELGRGQSAELAVTLEPTRQRLASYWVFGGAGTLTLGAGIATLVAFHADRSARAIRRRVGVDMLTPDDRDAHNRDLERRDRWKAAATVLWTSAAVAGTVGTLLYFLDSPDVDELEPGDLRVTPAGGSGGVGAAIEGVF